MWVRVRLVGEISHVCCGATTFDRQEASLLLGSVFFCCPLRGCVLDGTLLLRVGIWPSLYLGFSEK
jgi:hypothetical protein